MLRCKGGSESGRKNRDLNRLRLPVLIAVLFIAACANAPQTDNSSRSETSPGDPAIDQEIVYETTVERVSHDDGSVIVITRTVGSDGSEQVEQTVIPPSNRDGQDSPPNGTRGDEESDVTEEVSCAAGEDWIDFPWPPPEPSAVMEIPRRLLTNGAALDELLVRDIQRQVESALEAAGYVERAFFRIDCDGFAVVTRLEEIDSTGLPVLNGARFATSGQSQSWSLASYLARLFYAPPGFYRQIIVAGTDKEFDRDDLLPPPDEADLDELFERGSSVAIDIDEEVVWGQDHVLYALVYEFETEGVRDVKQNRPSELSVHDHLRRSGILEKFEFYD